MLFASALAAEHMVRARVCDGMGKRGNFIQTSKSMRGADILEHLKLNDPRTEVISRLLPFIVKFARDAFDERNSCFRSQTRRE